MGHIMPNPMFVKCNLIRKVSRCGLYAPKMLVLTAIDTRDLVAQNVDLRDNIFIQAQNSRE
jgi:hypothetical protein